MPLKKTEEKALAIGKKAKEAKAPPAPAVKEAAKPAAKPAAKSEVKAETKPVKPAKKAFAKLPDAPVSSPKPHVGQAEAKPEVKAAKKSASGGGAKFDPPAISLTKIRKAALNAASEEKTTVPEEPIKKAVSIEPSKSTHLPEALVRKPVAIKKTDKPVAAPGKKTLDDLFASRTQVVSNQTPAGFNPLDYLKR